MTPTDKDIEAAEKLRRQLADEIAPFNEDDPDLLYGLRREANDPIAQALAAAREEGRREKISAYDFVLGADACALLDVLSRAKCDDCSGQGERNDAEAGDISFNSWVCKSCDGKGWNKQAVVEIIGAVGPISPQPEIRNLPTNAPEGESVSRVGTNSGHGHVWERPDGMKARCGGPGICAKCARDKAYADSLPTKEQ